MALSAEQFKRFEEHLLHVKCPLPVKCPVCGRLEWSVSGPVVMLECNVVLDAGYASGGGGTPVVLMTCANCFFCYQFAWLPISKSNG